MNLAKYVSKLRKMSTAEITFRVKQVARNRTETLSWKASGGNGSAPDLFVPRWVANWDVQKHPFPAPDLQFFGLSGDASTLNSEFNSSFFGKLDDVRVAADLLLAHNFNLLGLQVQLPEKIQWNVNPQTGNSYPLNHFSQMDTFNTDKFGDVKYVWELNRHQFFIEVAKAYYLTGEEKYAEKIWQWLESWFAQVPHKYGINHTSVLEHAVRIFSWIWSYYFTQNSPVWTPERRAELAKQLLLQGDIIEENLSYFYSPYNHLIGELAALAFLGTVYPNSPKMQRWRDHYWAEMEAQLPLQFNEDGFTVEQASYYHHFTTGFYLQLALLRKKNNLPVSENVWQWLEKMLEFPMHLTRPDGQLPMLGDIDSARSIYFYRPEPKWDLRPFQAMGAVLFQRSDMKFVAHEPTEELLWLLGENGIADFEKLRTKKPAEHSKFFAPSGYLLMRDGWDKSNNYIMFDCGEIAHGVHKDDTPSAAHGHGDILAFELFANGKPLIVDPGFHTYFGDLAWHRYFRDSLGHNTITVNGCGQAVHEGRIGWSRVSSPKLRHQLITESFDYACAETDRFANLEKDAIHRRHIFFEKGKYAIVFDEVSGNATDELNIVSSLHFHPAEVQLKEQILFVDQKPAAIFAMPYAATIAVNSGGKLPEDGWNAPGYGEKLPAPVLRISATQKLPFAAAMLFPFGENVQKMNDFQIIETGDISIFQLNMVETTVRFYLNASRQNFIPRCENASETDALFVVESQKTEENPEWHFLKVSHLASDKLDISLNLGSDIADGVFVQLTDAGQSKVKILGNENN
ncbi:MAG: alginate lyase family protein [Calditrichia bacterium]